MWLITMHYTRDRQQPNNSSRRQLLLIAGPSRVGKSTLMKRIGAGELTAQFKSLGLDNIPGWDHMAATALFKNPAYRPTCLIVHFDLYKQLHRKTRYGRLKGLLSQYDEVYALTLCAQYRILNARVGIGLTKFLQKRWPFIRKRKPLKWLNQRLKKLIFYSKFSNIEGLYRQYHDILSDHPNVRTRWMMNTSKPGNSIILPMEQSIFFAYLALGTSPEADADI